MDEFIQAAKEAVKLPDAEQEINEALGYTELCEPLLREYHMVTRKLSSLTEIKEGLRKRILEFAGKDQRGAMRFGSMTLILKPRKGSVSVDWERYIVDEYGQPAWDDVSKVLDLVKANKAPILPAWIKTGKESVNVEVAEEATKTAQPEELPEG